MVTRKENTSNTNQSNKLNRSRRPRLHTHTAESHSSTNTRNWIIPSIAMHRHSL